jgi:hypothetical protein
MQAMDVLGLGALFACDYVEANLLAFVECLETHPDDCRMVDEDIWAAFLKDKAKPMPVIEPFYLATGHSLPLPKV